MEVIAPVFLTNPEGNPMQEVQNLETLEMRREFFTGKSDEEVMRKMSDRLVEHEAKGFTLVRRQKVGRNATCPCGSGAKFKKCCISKVEA